MTFLILGLLLFLGAHSVRIFAEDWRNMQIARRGEKVWKLGYTAISLAGFALIVWGYGLARQQPVVLWPALPTGVKHAAALLVWVAFVMITAAQMPGNAIQARLRHPMVLGVKVWAFAHLLANNTLADLVLFGSFLVWAVLDFRAARRRGPVALKPSSTGRTVAVVVAGTAGWALFAFWLHGLLIGVNPL